MSAAGRLRAVAGIALVLILALAHGAVAASNQPVPIQMRVDVGYGGNYRAEAWVPVRVTLTNAGTTVTGTVSVTNSEQSSAAAAYNRTAFSRSLVLPGATSKETTLYVPGADLGQSVEVSFISASRTLARQVATASQIPGATLFVGVLSQNVAAFVQLKGLGGSLADVQALVTPLDNRSLDPQALALANLDAIVVENFDTGTLAPDQVAAVESWVRGGGTLILLGGPTAQATLGGLPSALVPVRPGRSDLLKRVPSLDRFGSSLPAGDLLAADGPAVDARVLLDSSRVAVAGASTAPIRNPLVIERQVGLGSVIYSAIDPTLQPVSSWRGLPQYWTLLVSPARVAAATLTTRLAGIETSSSAATINSEVSSVAPPSVTLYEVLLGLYVLVLVPLNFVILYRFRRRDWSWATLPALAMIILVGVFVTAYYGRGRDLRTTIVNVAYLTAGTNTAAMQSYVGMVSPSSGDLSITPSDSKMLGAPLFYSLQNGTPGDLGSVSTRLSVVEDNGSVIMPDMRSWSSRSTALVGSVSSDEGLRSDLTLDRSGKVLGRVTNASSSTTFGVVLQAYGGPTVAVGDLTPGESAAVSLPLGTGTDSRSSIPQVYGSLASTLFGPGRLPAQGTANPRAYLGSASIRAPLTEMSALGTSVLEADGPIPTNPSESRGQRFQSISTAALGVDGSAAFASVLAVGWKSTPGLSISVNGASPARRDTDMIVQSIPVNVPAGRYSVGPAAISARLVGATQAFQSSFGGSSVNISPNSAAIFVAALPMPQPGTGSLAVSTVEVSVNAVDGGSLNSQSGALWDWASARWVQIDVGSGKATTRNAGRFVDAAGMVRVRIGSQSSTLSLGDPNSSVSVGASGEVL
jgi:hypothetical protein